MVDRADLAIQDSASITILLNRNKRRIVEQILHALEQRDKLSANEHDTTNRNGLRINQARTIDDCGLLRRQQLHQ